MIVKNTMLGKDEIIIGEPIPWDLVNEEGTVLFKKGFIFNSQVSTQRVFELHLRRICNIEESGPKQQSSPAQTAELTNSHLLAQSQQDRDGLETLASLMMDLKQWNDSVVSGVKVFAEDIQAIAKKLLAVCQQQPRTSLAAVHLFSKYPYANYHPIATAILCAIVGDNLGQGDSQYIESYICAALTANLSLYVNIDIINLPTSKLTQEQCLKVLNHPIKTSRILRAIGVNDPMWIELVENHHENASGRGYPNAIKLSNYESEINLYHLADMYLSLIGAHTSLGRLSCDSAMEKLRLVSKNDNSKHLLFKSFRKLLGKYPNGSLLELENGNTALVHQQHPESIEHPMIIALIDKNSKASNGPRLVSSENPEYAIRQGAELPVAAAIDLIELYCDKDLAV